jgi:hypothetical protein
LFLCVFIAASPIGSSAFSSITTATTRSFINQPKIPSHEKGIAVAPT